MRSLSAYDIYHFEERSSPLLHLHTVQAYELVLLFLEIRAGKKEFVGYFRPQCMAPRTVATLPKHRGAPMTSQYDSAGHGAWHLGRCGGGTAAGASVRGGAPANLSGRRSQQQPTGQPQLATVPAWYQATGTLPAPDPEQYIVLLTSRLLRRHQVTFHRSLLSNA